MVILASKPVHRLKWQRVVTQYGCPSCGAAPGRMCVSTGGRIKHEPHADRARLAAADHWVEHDEEGDALGEPTP
jgi:hypothetical protein